MKIKLTQKEALNIAADTLREKFAPESISVEMEETPVPSVAFVVPMPNLAVIRQGATRDISGYCNKIIQIKEIRAAFGWGLKEAKDFVEAFYP